MTPKEYADKLVHKCRLILLQSDSELSDEINLTIYAKQFALVALNEMHEFAVEYMSHENLILALADIEDIRQEIQKL